METLKIFHETEMFHALNYLNNYFNILDIEAYRNQYFFWKYDEYSYACFLNVLQYSLTDFNHDISTEIMTRSKTLLYRELINDVIGMLNDPIKDEQCINEEDMCLICTINKKCINLDCCKKMLCNKCNWIIIENNSKSCPFCRSKKY